MDELLDGFDPSSTRSIFNTTEQKRRTDDYFFKSASNISFFFEEKAFENDKPGLLTRPKHVSINKVGHALHDLDPVFRQFSRSAKIAKIMRSLRYRRPIPVQSMYIFKQPGIGGEVVPHQDNTFLYTEPPSCIGIWVALEDATKENGCLWALQGSHTEGKPVRRMVRSEEGGGGGGEGGGEGGRLTIRFIGGDLPNYDLSKFRPVEVKAGTAVILHGSVVHNSYENTSSKSRHAYSLHLVESDGCTWEKDNWLQREEGRPFEPLYVA
ncbi:hypothetical protein CBR_g31524 [Chara braunii]|uniref:Fe2OG dioxygenase domain-containing protein n=1 Tax=Chara braunii TaxID=69332 RepID=A0A388LFD2_CHABU|nr:hypothetical protein CBR_g31524 [Chara braunii]|eukprot:GBG80967.1 hypothetical protein CBR_g31524 [Chara braunii]